MKEEKRGSVSCAVLCMSVRSRSASSYGVAVGATVKQTKSVDILIAFCVFLWLQGDCYTFFHVTADQSFEYSGTSTFLPRQTIVRDT